MKERKTDITELLAFLLLRWRGILLWAIALAILASGWRVFSLYRSMRDSGRRAEAAEAEQRYKDDQANLKTRIEEQEKMLKDLRDYQEQSVYANLNPFDLYFASVTYRIAPETSSDGTALSNLTKVMRQYQRALDYGEYEDFRRNGKEMEARYVRELVYDIADYNNGLLTLQFLEADMESLERLESYVKDAIEEMTPDIVAQEGGFTITITDEVQPGNVVSANSLLDYSGSAIENLAKQQSAQTSNKNSYQNNIANYKKQLDELEEPEVKSISKKDLPKGFVTFGILGFLGGILAGAFVYSCIFASNARFFSDKQLEGEWGAYVLASGYRRFKFPLKKLDSLIYRHLAAGVFDLDAQEGEKGFYDVMAIQCQQFLDQMRARDKEAERAMQEQQGASDPTALEKGCPAAGRGMKGPGGRKRYSICLLSSCAVEGADHTAEMLRKRFPDTEFWTGHGILSNAETMDRLADSDAALLLEQKNRSMMAGIRQELRVLERMQKPLIGIASM